MRLLVVEDDPELGGTLQAALTERCFAVDLEPDGTRGSWLARTNDYDVIVLDQVLPGKSGKDICMELRAAKKSMPILMLTVQSEVVDKVDMLNAGADDYMTKPFFMNELVARIQALLRRPVPVLDHILEIGDLMLDLQTHEVRRAGHSVYLTRKELQLLEYFLRNAGRVLSRGQILEHVWDVDADPFSNTIETHILNLRRKIDREHNRKLIHTLPGRGYKLALEK